MTKNLCPLYQFTGKLTLGEKPEYFIGIRKSEKVAKYAQRIYTKAIRFWKKYSYTTSSLKNYVLISEDIQNRK